MPFGAVRALVASFVVRSQPRLKLETAHRSHSMQFASTWQYLLPRPEQSLLAWLRIADVS
jgi:hypothetical protein